MEAAAPTATAKRKRGAATAADNAPSAASVSAAAIDEVSDAEVEEFYAILRRMRDASRHFCSPAARAPAWCPSFSWEDFAPRPPLPPPAPAAPPPPVEERVAENGTPPPRPVALDLNAEPEPEAPAPAPASPERVRS
ncbi:protein NEGATIVE REGULATOR OF RESISTANCE [Brachypodium distachyon]|uniref:Uncharacterized protein n=1 Tax=Brachypodium distachyon TaxID=15368 RepID=I1HBN2_BRADI|nr:protein NEGATIVE REGULATOR OF RESISTANCE [Brachypodium distachyon]KQK02529.1 hypothetical protein BRADI_2g02060v3 [Brachypodium distachyon]|eukprot:XP_003565292.1 protein NEGATIVE REGULATOR OF RESISTANCE [Brachypodium distachyon]